MRVRCRWLPVAWISMALPLFAAEVPTPLQPWQDWVMKDQSWRQCPLLANRGGTNPGDYACVFPGRLGIDAQADGADFTMPVRVDAAGWVPLPGDALHWPQSVAVDGRVAEVVDRNGPSLHLQAGNHRISGRIPWQQRPQALRVPALIGLLSLRVDGNAVQPLQRDGEQLTLGRAASDATEADSLELKVYRLVADTLPVELTTQVQFYASGQAREETIGPLLPAGFAPLALETEGWAARLDSDGRLRVQVQPGDQVITLTARALAPLVNMTVPEVAAPWPAQEIWSWQADPVRRVASANADVAVDPQQAGVPDEWIGLPAFALSAGQALAIDERSRGASSSANRLTMQREAWLDFDGGGWFARDRINGTMASDWRFDVAEPYRLQRADNGYEADRPALLVTNGAGSGLTGVEWRYPGVDLSASLRIEPARGSLPISGWQQTFDRIDTTLHLPYGWRLLAAPGSDRADGSWIERWTLLDVFTAAIVTLLAWRLLGPIGGVCAGLFLLLGYQESGRPLALLVATLLLALLAKALPDGRFARVASALRTVAIALLVLAALPFAVQQLRLALYPQLEGSVSAGDWRGDRFDAPLAEAPNVIVQEPAPMSVPAPPPAPPAPGTGEYNKLSRSSVDNLQSVVVTGARIRSKDLLSSYDQSTVMQTGGGEASWSLGSVARLHWSGPILADQSMNLWIAPPWLVRSLRLLLVLSLAGLLVGLLRGVGWRRRATSGLPTLLIAGIVGVAAMAPAAQAQAPGFPDQVLLEQLKQRLLRAPDCAPSCISIAQAGVVARDGAIVVTLDVHALDAVALPLPEPSAESAASLRGIRVDGVLLEQVAGAGPTKLLPLSRGVHRVELDFRVGDRFDLQFPLRPYRVVFNGDGWQASGIGEGRLLGDTLSVAQLREASGAGVATGAQQFAPYVRVVRNINVGLDWSIDTEVQRLAPRSGGFSVAIPVLAGEHVTTPGLKVENGQVAIAIGKDEASSRWRSTLDKTETLTLTAPTLADRAEVWRFVAIPTWHVAFSGVPESASDERQGNDDYRQFVFHPLPGETLTVTITRPSAVAGATRAIDRVALTSAIGQRAATHTLEVELRASQGGDQSIALPPGTELMSVSRDGVALNVRAHEGRVNLPLQPGPQRYEIVVQQAQTIAAKARSAVFDIGLPLANVDLRVDLPEDRWLLAAWGPGVGPAVLFWGELLALVVLVVLLSRWRSSPLRWPQVLLLGLGFSTYSWVGLLLVLGWLAAIDWRERNAATLHDSAFNLVQIGFVLLTIVALFALLAGIRNGLLGQPDMVVTGYGSDATSLRWFVDRSDGVLPQASVLSLPIWTYRLVMLAWALWLAWAVVGWARQALRAATSGGLWHAAVKPVVDVVDAPTSGEDDSKA